MKHEIEIEGLPEGWEPVAYRKPEYAEKFWSTEFSKIDTAGHGDLSEFRIIVKKRQSRRIVLEESDYDVSVKYDGRYWRIVKESDLSLTNEETKLSLSVDECKKLLCNLDKDVMKKLQQFMKRINDGY